MNHQPHRAPLRPHAAVSAAAAGGREDCWSEGATETLIEAWGDRYLQLNRGNLRQKDWKEVADAVNGRDNGTKPRRTDVQCKNRVDTLKKKYKLERTKPPPSKWPFYFRLEHLIGNPNPNPPGKKPTTVTLTVKSRPKLMISNPNPNPNPNANTNLSSLVYSASSSRLNSSGSTESSLGDGGGGRDDEMLLLGGVRKHSRMEEEDDFSEESAFKELARAIVRFGEVYERIESSKQQQMMELEKQRMEFTKELEYQRMNMFMEAQLELEKMKRPANYPPGAGKKL